jgi:thioesterase domain-containing protein
MPLGSIEDIAAHHVRELRAFQPEGPYLLLGLTFGGMVAYEVARQLAEQGERAAMVAMIHAAPVGRKQPRPVRLSARERAERWVRTKVVNANRKAGLRFYEYLVRTGRPRPRRSPWDLQLMAASKARRAYTARPADVRVDWFGARGPDMRAYGARWEGIARGGVELHQVVGGDEDRWKLVYLTRPHVDALAEALEQTIEARLAEWERA